jgi:hypothetical protein
MKQEMESCFDMAARVAKAKAKAERGRTYLGTWRGGALGRIADNVHVLARAHKHTVVLK